MSSFIVLVDASSSFREVIRHSYTKVLNVVEFIYSILFDNSNQEKLILDMLNNLNTE